MLLNSFCFPGSKGNKNYKWFHHCWRTLQCRDFNGSITGKCICVFCSSKTLPLFCFKRQYSINCIYSGPALVMYFPRFKNQLKSRQKKKKKKRWIQIGNVLSPIKRGSHFCCDSKFLKDWSPVYLTYLHGLVSSKMPAMYWILIKYLLNSFQFNCSF